MQSSLIRKVSVLKYGVALLGFAALAGSLCVPGFSYDGPNCEGNKGSSAITQVSLLAPDSRTANFADSRTFPKSLYDQISKFLEEIENVEEQYPASLCESLLNCSGLLIEIDRLLHQYPEQVPPLLDRLEALCLEMETPQNFPRKSILEEIRLNIDRRVVLLRVVCSALSELGKEYALEDRNVYDLKKIGEKTARVVRYLDSFQGGAGEKWSEFFLLPDFEGVLRGSSAYYSGHSMSEPLSREIMWEICSRAAIVLDRFSIPLSAEQEYFLSHEVFHSWKKELEFWKDDTVHPLELLAAMEIYESRRLSSDSLVLSDLSYQLSLCKNRKLKSLGNIVQQIYGGPNIRIYVSGVLIDHFLPTQRPEFVQFRDIVVGRPVVGKRRTDALVKLVLDPHPTQLRMRLQVVGKVSATGLARAAKSTRIQSLMLADYVGTKQLEWTEKGIFYQPTFAMVNNNRTRLQSIRSGVDGLPLLSELVKDVAQRKFSAQQGQINAENRAKISNTVQNRINAEADGRFDRFNENYRKLVLEPMERSGLSLEKKYASTTEDWLLSSWRLVSDCSLGSHTLEPETVQGAFADLKIHESAIKTIIHSLHLEGKTMSVKELRTLIADRIGRPRFAEDSWESDDVILSFAENDPVLVRFFEGRIEIDLSMSAMKAGRNVWKNFKFIVNYRPGYDEEGNLCLKRDPEENVIARRNLRTQFALRTVISKLFPPHGSLSLVPKIFETDERFQELTVGTPRLENGWFALSIVEKKRQQTRPDAEIARERTELKNRAF